MDVNHRKIQTEHNMKYTILYPLALSQPRRHVKMFTLIPLSRIFIVCEKSKKIPSLLFIESLKHFIIIRRKMCNLFKHTQCINILCNIIILKLPD